MTGVKSDGQRPTECRLGGDWRGQGTAKKTFGFVKASSPTVGRAALRLGGTSTRLPRFRLQCDRRGRVGAALRRPPSRWGQITLWSLPIRGWLAEQLATRRRPRGRRSGIDALTSEDTDRVGCAASSLSAQHRPATARRAPGCGRDAAPLDPAVVLTRLASQHPRDADSGRSCCETSYRRLKKNCRVAQVGPWARLE